MNQNTPSQRAELSWRSGFLLLAVLAVGWEGLSRFGVVNPIFFPPLSRVIRSLFSLFLSRELIDATLITLGRCAAGYGIAALVAIPFGLLMGQWRTLERLLTPLVETLRPIPSAAVIPVAILFLGIDNKMKVAVVVFGSLWPILLNTIHGVHIIEPMLIDTGRTLNLTKRQLVGKIIIPAASPSILTGLRISLAISLILAITVEMIAGSSGLGFLILDYERSFKYAEMYAGIIALAIIGLCLNGLFIVIDRRFLGWSKQSPSNVA